MILLVLLWRRRMAKPRERLTMERTRVPGPSISSAHYARVHKILIEPLIRLEWLSPT